MTIKVFGQIAEIVGANTFNVDDVNSTSELVEQLQKKFPLLINSKYKIAVNRNIIQANTSLQKDAEIALLPPFSGG